MIYGDLLVYHQLSESVPYPHWETRPKFKNAVRLLGKLRAERIRAARAWKKLPEEKRTGNALSHYSRELTRSSEAEKKLYRRYPFLRPLVIPDEPDMSRYFKFPQRWRKKEDAILFAEFLYELSESRYLTQVGGAPSGTRALSLSEQKLAEKMRRRGKRTERGSIRFIAEELRERGNRKKLPALIQDIKRHFRRKGLIRRK